MPTAAATEALADPRPPRPRPSGPPHLIEALAERVGLEVGGRGPYAIQILDPRALDLALARGLTGLRDAYVAGWWDAERLDVVTDRVLSARIPLEWDSRGALLLRALVDRLRNPQSARRNRASARHYELGNEFFRAMLGRRMIYSCAYWRDADDLDDAQDAKLDLVCRKLDLRPGMRVLDIGCGWGGLARFAAERHRVHVTGVTIAGEQARLAAAVCRGLPVEIRRQDYRELARAGETYDRVVSIGMFEHVGVRNHRGFMAVVRRCLAPDGLALLHTIGAEASSTSPDPWIDAHIFPNALLPSMAQIAAACEGQLLVEDWHNFGADYDPTLMAWYANFERAWPEFRERLGDRFHRVWKCYLLTCAGSFRARRNQLWQLVLSAHGVRGGHASAR